MPVATQSLALVRYHPVPQPLPGDDVAGDGPEAVAAAQRLLGLQGMFPEQGEALSQDASVQRWKAAVEVAYRSVIRRLHPDRASARDRCVPRQRHGRARRHANAFLPLAAPWPRT